MSPRAEMNRARLEGQLQGEREGELKGQQELVLRLLTRRVGNVSIADADGKPFELETSIRALPVERLEEFGEALLDFTRIEDAIAWFDL